MAVAGRNAGLRASLSGRNALVVQYVARFKQLSASHIHELVFYGLSNTPCDRALHRLMAAGYLHRIEHRMVGGANGGSGQYAYVLGREGFWHHYEGRYTLPRRINYHSLAIADTYIEILRLERSGGLELAGVSTEPDCWRMVGDQDLRPDLYAEIMRPGQEDGLHLFIEVDMATESQRQLREKFSRYWRAWNAAVIDHFPLIVFVTVDELRAKEISWLLNKEKPEVRALFRVMTLERLVENLR